MNIVKIIALLILIYGCRGKVNDESKVDSMIEPQEIREELKQRAAYEIFPDNTYVELNTGKRVKLNYDDKTHAVIEQGSNREIDLFVDESTLDTIDGKGRIVNNFLFRKNDGTYVTHEADTTRF